MYYIANLSTNMTRIFVVLHTQSQFYGKGLKIRMITDDLSMEIQENAGKRFSAEKLHFPFFV